MRRSQKRAVATALLTTAFSINSFGWGEVGHRIVAEVGGQISTAQIWVANETTLGKLTNVPDKNWKSGKGVAEEKPTHYFEPDGFFSDINDFIKFPRPWATAKQKYGEKTLIDHGTAVWRVQQLAAMAVKNLMAGNFKSALEMAGTMSHYVGDLSQPLHVTTNYDGQETNQNGIHKYFETTNLNSRPYQDLKDEVVRRAKILLRDSNFLNENSGGLENMVFNEVTRSFSRLDEVLKVDEKYGRTEKGGQEQLEIAYDALAAGAATMSLVLAEISKRSGVVAGQTVQVDVPNWVSPNYDDPVVRKRMRKLQGLSFFKASDYSPLSEADCQN